jgi:hypothetical protein
VLTLALAIPAGLLLEWIVERGAPPPAAASREKEAALQRTVR